MPAIHVKDPAEIAKLIARELIPADWNKRPTKQAAVRKVALSPAVDRPAFVGRMEFPLPVRIVSEANRHEHWRAKAKRAKGQKEIVAACVVTQERPGPPLVVTLTRHGWQKQDDDNLRRSFKAIRDALAAWIGVDDGSDEIEWRYRDVYARPAVWCSIEGKKQ